MINWITNEIGTSAYLTAIDEVDHKYLIDVRDMVDKDGNTQQIILDKVEDSLRILKRYSKVVICCDYGMSRSNSIAAAVLSKYKQIDFSSAVRVVLSKVLSEGIKPELLNDVYNALNTKTTVTTKAPRVLVTGINGFVGATFERMYKNSFFLKGVTSKDCNLLKDPITLDLIIKENSIDTLIHLANPRVYTLITSMGESITMLKNVLEVCRTNKVKLVYISSWEVFSGYRSDLIKVNENTPILPIGTYSETKWLCENLITHYNKTYGLESLIIRSTPLYGNNSDKPKFIYNFIDLALRNKPIVTHKYKNGDPALDLLYVDDFCEALFGLVSNSVNGIIHVASGVRMTTREIAERIVSIAHSKSSITSNFINNFYPDLLFDLSEIHDRIGWYSKSNIDSFLRGVIDGRTF